MFKMQQCLNIAFAFVHRHPYKMSHLINNMQHFLLHILCCMFLRFQDYVKMIIILQWHKGVSTGMTTMQTYMYLFTHLWSQHLTITWKSKFLQQDLHHHFTEQTNMNMCYIQSSTTINFHLCCKLLQRNNHKQGIG